MRQPAVYIHGEPTQRYALHRRHLQSPAARPPTPPSALTGFTGPYGCTLLAWYDPHDEMSAAIAREKQIKAGSRRKKLALIEAMSPVWRDLHGDLA